MTLSITNIIKITGRHKQCIIITLKYIILIFFLYGCSANPKQPAQDELPLYPEPLNILLYTTGGYNVNKITGDSIKPLLTSSGDSIKTGVYIPFTGQLINEAAKPRIRKPVTAADIITNPNVHPVPESLTGIRVDTNRLTKVKLGEGNQSFVLRNATGVIPTGVPVPITGKKIPSLESPPVKALPFKYKDAATANVQYLDVDQGLASSYIYSLLEDKKGNMWFGIPGVGISKYDGVSFVTYTIKGGLGENSVHSIIEDNQGNIWLNTNKGIISFDGKTFTQFTEKEGLPGNGVISLQKDKKGNIWISTLGSGVGKYDGKNITWYTTKEGLPCDSVLTSMEDKNGNIWLSTNHGAARFDGNLFTWYKSTNGLPYESFYSLLEDKKGNIWMGANSGVVKYDGKSFVHYSEREGFYNRMVWSMLEDRKGNIWFGTTFGGIHKFDGPSFTQYSLTEGLSNNKVRQIIEDRNGNIWFGTDGGGVNKLSDGNFGYLPPNEILANNRVRPIIKDRNGNMWFGTEGAGLGKYEAKNLSGAVTKLSYYKRDSQISLGQRSLLEGKNGNIWIGASERGINQYEGKNIVSYPLSDGLSAATIFSMLEDKKGNTWFGTDNSTGILKYDGNNFTGYTVKDGLPGTIVFCIYEDKKRNIWLGTDAGTLSNINGNSIINYSAREGFFGNGITSVIEDDKGSLWLGTTGAGVCRFDGKQFTYYTEKQGLSNNNVWSLIRDPAGHIWAGTDNGLNRFVPNKNNKQDLIAEYTIYKYGLQDGLKAVDFNLHGACIDNNNHIWWGTGKNILIKDLNNPFETTLPYSLSLTNIVINDRLYNYRDFPDSVVAKIKFSNAAAFTNYPENLKLSYDQNHLAFNFSAIDWSAPDKIQYSYRLSGLDDKWSNPSAETKAEYRNLQHGNYIFQVRAIGASQQWTAPLTYTFTIHPAWWQTFWFKIMVALAILTLLFLIGRFIYFYQLRKERVALEKKLAVQYERQRISAEMHDDIGAGLSGIRLLTEMTKNKVKNEKGAEEVDKIYQSVGDISSKMKEVIWSLNTENDNLTNLLSYIQKQVRLWLEHYPCQLAIDMPDTIPDVQVNGESRRNIFLIVKEAVHNIIKHSGADRIVIKMDCNNEQLIITISDNGKGISNGQNNNSGNGMKNMRQRIEKLNAKFFVNNKEGLTLIAEIPLQPTL